ncbi:GIY-YIG nuclease family protein [Mycoplasma marinum]|uniref:GIY-YIG domain-containing protein n=1 Tax=Mycoplasma marinum TaxID=1937190 RepID=A0A4R0XJ15_9MOLU|nr:GIY-YIG nuclease family protein [Mycoplasma marinum]TCG10606.1 hypothetical protein C4B24_04405 [Mycoplasma marinum]
MKRDIKTEIRAYDSFELIFSPNQELIIIKINNNNGNFDDTAKIIENQLKNDYLSQAGVYFLRLDGGYYIGETINLKKRFSEHEKMKEFSSITFATYKYDLEELNKEQIRDLESILIEFANDNGLTLGNAKIENRKTRNLLNHNDHINMARWIWKNFSYLNIEDIFDELNSNQIQDIENKGMVKIKTMDVNRDNSITKQIVVQKDVKNKVIDKNHKIFKFLDFNESPTKGYMKIKIEIYNKNSAVKCLFDYLYKSKGNATIDSELTNSNRVKGWIAAATLAYFRIQTNGTARGTLNSLVSKEKAFELIKDFVDLNY